MGDSRRSSKNRKAATVALVACLVLAGTASAATGWTAKDMTSAARALHYPKAGAIKTTCRGKMVFRCVATYKHHRHRVFYAQWNGGETGWILAGAKPSTLKPLRKGFVPRAQTRGAFGDAQRASIGWMDIHYQAPQPFVDANCPTTAAPAYTFCYKLDTGSIQITVTVKKTRAGNIFTATPKLAAS